MGSGRDRTRDLDLQPDSHLLPDTLPTALRGPVHSICILCAQKRCFVYTMYKCRYAFNLSTQYRPTNNTLYEFLCHMRFWNVLHSRTIQPHSLKSTLSTSSVVISINFDLFIVWEQRSILSDNAFPQARLGLRGSHT